MRARFHCQQSIFLDRIRLLANCTPPPRPKPTLCAKWEYKADLATERERHLMTARRNHTSDLTNSRTAIWHKKSCVVLSARFPVVNWRSRSVAKSVELGKGYVGSFSKTWIDRIFFLLARFSLLLLSTWIGQDLSRAGGVCCQDTVLGLGLSESVLTWRHGGHIGVPKQWNGGHIGVPNQSRGSWTLFLCKRFLLFQHRCWPREWKRSTDVRLVQWAQLWTSVDQ